MIICVRLSINLINLTMEQVIGKRRKMLCDMLPRLEEELREQTCAAGGLNAILASLQPAIRSRLSAVSNSQGSGVGARGSTWLAHL